ncbi:MAG: lytic murein transglycosylase [Deltaproteobacteria bacterium]|nr:lytic murein transglycosylase [Deltaproteobacteria bacterium]
MTHRTSALSLFVLLVFFTTAAVGESVSTLQPKSRPSQSSKLTITAVGDINMGTAFPSEDYLPPDGGSGLLSPIKHLLKGDIVFGNLEGPLADGGKTDKCSSGRGCYAFRTPTAYVKNLVEAGFTVMSIANNHGMDFGEAGRQSTLATLDKAGLAHSGPLGDIAELEIKGKKVALIAFTTADHSYNLLDIEQAVKVVKEQDKTHDLIIVSFHGGSEGSKATRVPDRMEYLGKEPRGHLRNFTHAVIEAGADLVLGHGPHVLRGMEVYQKRLIIYSLGNFCTYARFNLSGPLGIGLVLSVDLDLASGEFIGGKMHSTLQPMPGGALRDPKERGRNLIKKLSREDFRFNSPLFEKDGLLAAPPGDGAGLFTLKTPEERMRLTRLLTDFARAGFSETKLRTWFGDKRAELLPEVMKRFRRPAEKMPYAKYRAIFIKKDVLEAGKKFMREKKELLERVKQKHGVDIEALTGLIATETRFGTHKGKYLTFNALATVVFRYERRSRWGQKELEALLTVFKEDPFAVTGSYAGAVGLVQFMPTSIKAYAVDFNGDNRIDLDDWEDAVASAANYLKKHGWKLGEPIKRGKPNYKAIYRYNPAHNYVKVITELADTFGYRKDAKAAEKNAKKKKKKKKKSDKKTTAKDKSGPDKDKPRNPAKAKKTTN